MPPSTRTSPAARSTVTRDGSDAITISCDGEGKVVVPNALVPLPGTACNTITAIDVTGGDGANVITLTGVTEAAFTALDQTTINAGDGEDRIFGSEHVDDPEAGGLDTLARTAGLSPSHLSRIFKSRPASRSPGFGTSGDSSASWPSTAMDSAPPRSQPRSTLGSAATPSSMRLLRAETGQTPTTLRRAARNRPD
jgi:hypothetical protein